MEVLLQEEAEEMVVQGVEETLDNKTVVSLQQSTLVQEVEVEVEATLILVEVVVQD